MIDLTIRRVRPGQEQRLRDWFAEVQGPRRAEAEATLIEEGIDHETAALIDTGDGLLLVYAMQSEDFERARKVAYASTLPIDEEHRANLRACLLPFDDADLDVVLDLQPG
ncbi:DUF6176 family protein [Cellulomonas timonensis]|uniref:DUF6176 family protein n=1 Tax=Cellulomonas timonensis TaxID=1689271 RepID=UPI000833A7A7|nr:DUF6176 family protein [Cellulomonas timonensis]